MSDYTEAELASMTQAERDSINEELHDDGPSQFVDDADVATANAAKIAADAAEAATAKPAAVEDPAAAAEPAAGTEQVVVPAVAAEAEPEPDYTPPFMQVFKAPLVTDEAHALAQAALMVKFENGELTTPQLLMENDRLSRAKAASDMAVQSAAQSEDQAWGYIQDRYFAEPGNAVLREDPRFWSMIQADLEVQYQDPANANKTDAQFLRDAGNNVKQLLGLKGEAPAPTAQKPAAAAKKPAQLDSVDIPTTLEGVPAADANADAAGGEFAHMANLEGMDYELAVARMSKEQQARFLAI